MKPKTNIIKHYKNILIDFKNGLFQKIPNNYSFIGYHSSNENLKDIDDIKNEGFCEKYFKSHFKKMFNKHLKDKDQS